MEARPSSDPLPAGVTANLVEAAIPSCNTSPSTQSASPSGADQENDKAAPAANTATQPLSLPSGNAGEMVVREPSANPSEGTAATQDIVDLVLPSQPAQAQRQHPQLQNQHPQLQEAMPASHKSGHAAAQNSRQANGHLSPESSPHGHSMDEDDAALLADMQGFASALGCDWQVLVHIWVYAYCVTASIILALLTVHRELWPDPTLLSSDSLKYMMQVKHK